MMARSTVGKQSSLEITETILASQARANNLGGPVVKSEPLSQVG
jgi:hypothetical protein